MHQHQVYDTDNHFVIDPITKEIVNRSEKMKLMQGDHNSERFTFEIPRYIDGHDMTLCDKIEVHYINIDSKTKESNKDVYIVDDMQLSPNGEDVVIFSWLISGNATQLAGTLNFRATFKCISEPSIIDYQMSTEIFKGITVSDGISNSESVVEEYSDVLEQWKQELNLAGEYAQQIQQNASEIDELQAGLSESRNYVNKIINYEIKWNDGGYISKDDGNVNNETGSSYSDFVTVRPGTKLVITNTTTMENGYNAFYDQNDKFLSSFPNATGEVVVPGGAVKMRLSKYSTATLSVASNVKTYIDDSIEKVEANAKLTDDAVNELKGDLSSYGIVIPVDFTNVTNGEFITHTGTKADSVSFSMSEPIWLEKGQKITFKATGYLTYVSMIAKYISDTKYQMLVRSIDSSEREYSYIAETDMYVVLSFETAKNHVAKIGIVVKDYCDNSIDEVKQSLSDYGLIRNVDFSTAIYGEVILAGGYRGNSEGFSISQPIKLYKGEKISLLATGYQTDIAMISEYTGTGYICLVKSEDNTEKYYSYTATRNMDIVISYRNLSIPKATIISNASVVPEQMLSNTFGKLGMFPRMAIIGDSLGSGAICDGEYSKDRYGTSWLSFLARKNGATARTHYSNGGICCKSWLTKYLTKMQSDNAFNAYFIALGTNDKYLDQYPLGSISDVSGTDSFVGYYKQIVDAVREKAPHAVIFCVSLYTLQGAYVPYSNMVSEIADLYDNCFFIDFANNSDIRIDNGSSDYVSDAHFTTIGYQYVASVIDKLVNEVIDENKSFFKFFAKNNSVGEQYED